MIDILIADDNDTQSKQISNVLSKEKDFKILKISRDGIETLEDYITLKPSVLILDLDMPKINGLDVIEQLSNDTNFDSRKNIIVVSGSTLFRSQICNPKKIKWIFTKPFDYEQLFIKIREIKKEKSYKPSFKKELDELFFSLDLKTYTKGSKYLKCAIDIAYNNYSDEMNISNITKQIAWKYKISNSDSIQSAMDKTVSTLYFKNIEDIKLKRLFSADYKITTKDFISRAIYYIDNN